MKKKSNRTLTPKLRFPEFRDDGEWSEEPLDGLSTRIRRKVGSKKLTPVSITAGVGFVDQTKKFGRRIAGKQYKNYIHIQRGDFVYNKGNSKTFAQGCIYQLREFEEAAASTAFICFKLNESCVDHYFQSLFECNTHGRKLLKFITSGARSDGLLNINPTDFFSIELPLPPRKAEQQKIGDCLSSLDRLIAAECRKLEALKAHKKGLMQQLFPQPGQTQPRLRFPEFRDKGEWKKLILGDVISISKGKGITKSDVIAGGTTPCIRYAELYTIYGEVITHIRSRTDVPVDTLVLSQAGDVIIPASGETKEDIATCGCVMNAGVALGSDLNVLRSDIDGRFFSYYLNGVQRSELAKVAQGDTVAHLYPAQISRLSICIAEEPTEQQKIADCLSALDDRIISQAAKIETLKTHKCGLMQQLFPAPEED
uniref:restriction endonuclease subunit S n=1 Tax=Candidatus Electrothrix sp. TaxID=2170559 RepID=UPI004055FB10